MRTTTDLSSFLSSFFASFASFASLSVCPAVTTTSPFFSSAFLSSDFSSSLSGANGDGGHARLQAATELKPFRVPRTRRTVRAARAVVNGGVDDHRGLFVQVDVPELLFAAGERDVLGIGRPHRSIVEVLRQRDALNL